MASPLAHDGSFSFTKREARMYRKLPPETNYKAILKEYLKGFGAVCAIFVVIMLAEMAFSQPVCALDYHSGVVVCQ